MRFGSGGGGDFEDRTGQSGGGMQLGGMGGGALGLIFSLVASRFGIVGIIILALGYCALSSLGGGGGGGLLGGGGSATSQSSQGVSTLNAEQKRVIEGTNNSTAQVWTEIFRQAGATYKVPKLIAYTQGTRSGCGAAQSAMGPFYCPTDQGIYIDPSFFDELTRRFGAPGDFAQIYVIAHEAGHHVQNLEGKLGRGSNSNQEQVGIELQADCYAGVWANRAKAFGDVMEPGDIEEGMRAAEAIGDDTLQKQSQGVVVPESFTHGTSAQRMEALRRGLQSGDPAKCNYS
ncbi:MAG: neutral zinc metallopeptidase [Pseudomonadota bacterium]|nr:neutral zinc metallopeptidase [Pseudomonadota bacterium]